MPRVATFCPRCGESIDTELPEEARSVGRAELVCPACRFRFVIAPAERPQGEEAPPEGSGGPVEEERRSPGDEEPRPEPRREHAPAQAETGQESEAPAQRQPTGGVPQATHAHAAKRRPSGSLPARLLSAGLLLFFAAALGLFYAIVFANAPGIFQDALDGPEGTGEVEGFVVSSDRDAIEGARVSVLEQVGEGERPDLDTPTAANTTTGPEGRFQMGQVDPGVRWLKVELEGHRTTFFQTWALSAEEGSPGQPDLGSALWEVVLRQGEEDDVAYQTEQVSLLESILRIFQISGWVAFPASVLSAVAGVFVLMRRSFALSVTGAVAGILAVGFLVGALMALIALILILTARHEFTPFKKPAKDPEADAW